MHAEKALSGVCYGVSSGYQAFLASSALLLPLAAVLALLAAARPRLTCR